LHPLAFILYFLSQFWTASRLVCRFCEGSLSVVSITVSSAKVAVVDSGEVGVSAVYNRYNNGPRKLPCGTPALSEDSSLNLLFKSDN
jgi:hypothetical protein